MKDTVYMLVEQLSSGQVTRITATCYPDDIEKRVKELIPTLYAADARKARSWIRRGNTFDRLVVQTKGNQFRYSVMSADLDPTSPKQMRPLPSGISRAMGLTN